MKKALLFLLLCGTVATQKASAFTTITVQDSISTNTHWTNDKQYLLKGYVYVTSGATLTIDSGCIIKGDKNTKGALIVERGAKIYAVGTPSAPIVFTSSQPANQRSYGDWGGIILCGYAPNNWSNGTAQVEGGPRSIYGGTDPHDNSGRMSYVRIEFPGIAFTPNNEVNGITFCSVGDSTQIDHIQVSYSGDDAAEFFGGTVNVKYMIAYRTWDDDFDTDNGYRGKVQFGVIQRDPYAADNSGSKGFESDSYQTGTASGLLGDTTMLTRPVFSNITAVGPMISPTSTAYDPQFVSGVHIRRGSSISILNSIIAGWPCGVLIDESSASFGSTAANIGNGALQFQNNIIAGTASNSTPNPKDIVYVINGARSLTVTTTNADTVTGTPFAPYDGPWTWLTASSNQNKIFATEQTGVRLQNPFNLSNPDFRPTSTSPVAYNGTHTFNPNNPINTDTTGNYANYNVPAMAPSFNGNKASDPFFTKVNYVGAFSGTGSTNDNWFAGWTNFSPDVTDYSSNVNTLAVSEVAPLAFNQVAIHPNPASSNAVLMLEVKQSASFNVTMLDVTGKVVKTIYNGQLSKGDQALNVDLNNVTSGLYFVVIQTQDKVKTVKLSVVK